MGNLLWIDWGLAKILFVVVLIMMVIAVLFVPVVLKNLRRTKDHFEQPASGWQQDPTDLDEELLADQVGLRAELDALQETANQLNTSSDTVNAVRSSFEARLARIHREEGNPSAARREENRTDEESHLRSALVWYKRHAIHELRNRGEIDDAVLRRVTARIDLEELRLSAFDNADTNPNDDADS